MTFVCSLIPSLNSDGIPCCVHEGMHRFSPIIIIIIRRESRRASERAMEGRKEGSSELNECLPTGSIGEGDAWPTSEGDAQSLD